MKKFETLFSTSNSIKKSIKNENNENEFELFNHKKTVSIYLKILLNYIQLISIIQSMEMKWPYYAKEYFGAYSNFGSVSTQTISFECLLHHYAIDIQPIYFETFFSIILPYLTFIFGFFIVRIFLFLKRKRRDSHRFVVIVIVSSIFLQPTIIKMLYKNLICKRINSQSMLTANLMIDCDASDHKKWYNF